MRAGLLSALLAMTLATPCLAVDYEDISVFPETVAGGTTHHGYLEVRFNVENRSPDKSHTVEVIIPADRFPVASAAITTLRSAVSVAPRSSATISLYQPPLPISGANAAVIIDGERQDEKIPYSPGPVNSGHNASRPNSVLLSRSVPDPLFADRIKSQLGNGPVEFVRSEAPSNSWPRTWLGFSRYDGVVIASTEWPELTAETRGALMRWVRAGGSLVILGDLTLTDNCTNESPDVRTCYSGFGEIVSADVVDPSDLTNQAVARLNDAWSRSGAPWRLVPSSNLSAVFPIADRVGLPVGGMFLFMVAFALVVGPLNIWYLSRRDRKIWLLWTVPLLAFAASGMLIVYAVASEGFQRAMRIESLTLLDENNLEATTVGWIGYYFTVARDIPLDFSTATEVTPWRRSRDEEELGVVWADNQRLVGSWLRSRVSSHFMIRKNERRRERLVVRGTSGNGVMVVNALGATIRKVHYADPSGVIYYGENIAPGAEQRLRPSGKTSSMWAARLRETFGYNWIGIAERPLQDGLMPDSYYAILASSPFIETGTSKASKRQNAAAVYGLARVAR